jgi:thiol-disulfide isomerase/thioredoxin
MKKISNLFLAVLLLGVLNNATAQENIPVRPDAPYLTNKNIPAFNLLLIDGKNFTQNNIPDFKYTLIIYFSPDCGHCQHEATEMVKNIDSLKHVYFVWAGSRSIPELKAFSEKYGFNALPNVVCGQDQHYSIPSYYQVKYTPFVAVYDNRKQFVKAYEMGVEIPELLKLIGTH